MGVAANAMLMREVKFESVRLMSLIWSHLDFLHPEARVLIFFSVVIAISYLNDSIGISAVALAVAKRVN